MDTGGQKGEPLGPTSPSQSQTKTGRVVNWGLLEEMHLPRGSNRTTPARGTFPSYPATQPMRNSPP